MRIIGGHLRGLKLVDVGKGDAAAHLRPTSDRVREAIFNLLINGGYDNPVVDARVLDLFAGTGALGLEALSRGAASAIFVDDGARAQALLRQNIAKCRAEDRCEILSRRIEKLGTCTGEPCTLAFLDPPYGKSLGEKSIAAALAGGWLAPGAIVVWEEAAPPILPPEVAMLDQRRYGETVITIGQTK